MIATQTLSSLMHTGRTLVFCPTRAEAARIQFICDRLRIPYVCTNNNLPAAQNFATFCDVRSGARVMIAVVPSFATGVRFDVNRVIWIGDVPEVGDANYALYVQSITRARDASLYTFKVGSE